MFLQIEVKVINLLVRQSEARCGTLLKSITHAGLHIDTGRKSSSVSQFNYILHITVKGTSSGRGLSRR